MLHPNFAGTPTTCGNCCGIGAASVCGAPLRPPPIMDVALIKPGWLLSRLGPSRPRFSSDALAPLLGEREKALALLGHLRALWPLLSDPPAPFALVKQRLLLSLLTLRAPWDEGVEAAARDLVAEALRCCCGGGGVGGEGGGGGGADDSARRLQLIGAALVLSLRPCLRGGGAGGEGAAREAEAAACLAGAVGAVARGARARLAAARAGGLGGASGPVGGGEAPLASSASLASLAPAAEGAEGALEAALRLCSLAGQRGLVGGARSVHPLLNRWTAGLVWEQLPLETRCGTASGALRGALRSCGAPGGPAALLGGAGAPGGPAALLGGAGAPGGPAALLGGAGAGAGAQPLSRDFFVAATTYATHCAREKLLARALEASDVVLQSGGGQAGGEGGEEGEGAAGAAAAELSTSLSQIAAFLRPGLDEELAELDAAARQHGAGTGLLAGRGAGAPAPAPRAAVRAPKRPREAALLVEEEEEEDGGGDGAAGRAGAAGGSWRGARGGGGGGGVGEGAAGAGSGGGGGGGGGAPLTTHPAAQPAAQSSERLLALLSDAPLLEVRAREIIEAFAAGRNKLESHPSYSAAAAAAAAAAAPAAPTPQPAPDGGAAPAPQLAPSAPQKFPGLPPGASPKLQFELRQEAANLGVGGIGGGGGGGDVKIMCVVLELDFAESKWRCFRKKRMERAAKK